MSKHVIDTTLDNVKKVIAMGVTKGGAIWTDTTDIENLEELNSDYIKEHFGDLQDTAYKKGFEDGKAVNNKGCEGCLYNDGAKEHSPCDICCNAYLNRWTAKPQEDDEIKVGDEVADKDGDKTIVTSIHGDLFDGLCSDGSTMMDLFLDDNHKTGRHFDIASILEEMRHD